MQIIPLAALLTSNASTGSTPASATSTPSSQLNGDDFMTLLAAQLQSQDPLNPMDPTQFVGQLVQFNTLEQIIQIRQDIENQSASQTTPAPASVTGQRN